MADQKDKLLYFRTRGKAEGIRMLYVVAGTEFEDMRITQESWPEYKPEAPLGQIPTLTTSDGVICQSNVIARHVAKKLGLMGKDLWEETLHDQVTECAQDCASIHSEAGFYQWMAFNWIPEPDNSEDLQQKAREKLIPILKYIETIAKKRGKKYIVGDELGLAELFLYTAMEFCKVGTPDVMTLTPWVKQFVEKLVEDPKLKKYLAERPDSKV